MTTAKNTFETTSRKLEQFLYMHDIHHTGIHKNEDGMTVWEYDMTGEVKQVVAEYREIVARRQEREKGYGNRYGELHD